MMNLHHPKQLIIIAIIFIISNTIDGFLSSSSSSSSSSSCHRWHSRNRQSARNSSRKIQSRPWSSSSSSSSSRLPLSQQPQSTSSDSNTTSKNNTKKATTQGVYIRPSGAIERGSGFFVPGLEGPRVRLVVGTVLLVLTVINHVLLPTPAALVKDDFVDTAFAAAPPPPTTTTTSTIISLSPSTLEEGLAVTYSLLILFQAAIEYVKEVRSIEQQQQQQQQQEPKGAPVKSSSSSSRPSSSQIVLPQKWSASAASVDDKGDTSLSFNREKVQWAAASFLAMTPATTILLLTNSKRHNENDGNGSPQILYQLGGTTTTITGDENDDQQKRRMQSVGINSALDQVRQSKGGRISLPMTHPSVEALVQYLIPSSSSSSQSQQPRTVILQRITDDSCWMVSSDQLLASFTPNDLKWLGQLAKYVGDA